MARVGVQAGILTFPRPQATSLARAGLRVALLGTLLGLGWLMAPALSAEPYVPEPRDFEQTLAPLERVAAPGAAREAAGAAGDGSETRAAGAEHADHPGEGPVTHRSAVIDAPARFDLAGLAGEMRPFELRGRTDGGEWTDWVETANGDPVWFGGMDELQVRARGWRPAGSLHYVNVSGDATAGEGALTSAREAVDGALSATVSIFGADEATAGSTMPDVVTRKQWGAEGGGCEPRRTPAYGKVKAAAVHHTVNAVDYSEAEAPGIVLGICRFHRNGNGWDDIGYNALVDRFGNIYAGRDGGLGRAVVGAQMQGFNAQTTGVAVIGTHTTQPISKQAMRGVSRWLAWKLPQHGLSTEGTARMVSAGGSATKYPAGTKVRTKRIIGHRRTGLTACPGDALDRQLKQLTKKVQRRIGGGGGGSGGSGGGSGGGGVGG